jgi:hypothetical protein
MQVLSSSLSSSEEQYLHVLLNHSSQVKSVIISVDTLRKRLTEFGAAKLSAIKFLIHLHHKVSSSSSRTQNQVLATQAEIKIISILGLLKNQKNVKQTVFPIKMLIGEMLVTYELITRAQLNEAIAEQKVTNRRIGEILIKKKWITFNQLDELLTTQVDIRMEYKADNQRGGFILTPTSNQSS